MTLPSHLAAVPLLPPQRRERIIGFLQRHGAVTLQQLAQALDVSLSTLRRDLDSLEAEGLLARTHGGAILRQQHYSTFEPDASAAAEPSPREKRAIGIAAVAALQPGQSVIFDSGTTVMEAARAALERRIPLVTVTNDLAIAQLLGSSALVRVHVLGGQMRPGSNTLTGDAVLHASRDIRADVLLLGAHAVTNGEISETLPEVAAVKRAFIAAAARKVLLVDASKFRPSAFMRVCSLAELDELVADRGAPPADTDGARSAGISVTLVDVA
jgi:DeoR family transcriptional regulator of aga operon